MSHPDLQLVNLIKPGEGDEEVEKIYEEICKIKDPRWLGPLFGFFANVPGLLKAWWELMMPWLKITIKITRKIFVDL